MPKFDEAGQEQKLREMRKKEEENFAVILSEKQGIPYTDLSIIPVSISALTTIPEFTARDASLAVFSKKGKKLDIAVSNPQNKSTQKVLEKLEKEGYKNNLFISSKQSLETAWERYAEISKAKGSLQGEVELSEESLQNTAQKIKKIDDVRKIIEQEATSNDNKTTTKFLDVLIAGSLATHASDIHIEPEENSIRIRYRLDGILQDVASVSTDSYRTISSRIKLTSGLKLNIKDRAQDGRFTIKAHNDEIEVRTSVIPGAYGETIVMRVLDPRNLAVDMEKLGFDNHLLSAITKEIEKPNGMLLNTGPTGSGKTTTLYSFLKKVNKPGIKIITIEDPIEYHLNGITQTQVKKNYTFSEGLRSALRQDPDIIMVGEIRDEDTARTAINASLTGHLVFSTLHTNSAAGVIARFIDLGVDENVLGDALTVAMAQRLIRLLCKSCKEEYKPSDEELTLLNKITSSLPERYKENLPDLTNLKLWKHSGCDKCNNTGYKGRAGVFEAIFIDEKMSDIILKKPNEHEIWTASRDQGYLRMHEDAILKVIQGVTDISEIKRVVELD